MLAGLVFDPMRDECWAAMRDEPPTLNGEPLRRPERSGGLATALVATGLRLRRGRARRAGRGRHPPAAARARHPPPRLGRARPRVDRRGALRRVLRARDQAVGHRGRRADLRRARGSHTRRLAPAPPAEARHPRSRPSRWRTSSPRWSTDCGAGSGTCSSMLIAGVIVFCVLLLILAFVFPKLSRHPERGGQKVMGTGSRGASKAPGPLGRWFSKPFNSSSKAISKSGASLAPRRARRHRRARSRARPRAAAGSRCSSVSDGWRERGAMPSASSAPIHAAGQPPPAGRGGRARARAAARARRRRAPRARSQAARSCGCAWRRRARRRRTGRARARPRASRSSRSRRRCARTAGGPPSPAP